MRSQTAAWEWHGEIFGSGRFNQRWRSFFFLMCRYLVCDMAFHFVSLPLIFYPMHFLWKVKVSFYKYQPWIFVLTNRSSSNYCRVTLPALDIWQSSPLRWQRLYLGWIGRSILVRPRCFKMSALVAPPGLTMSRSILPPGTAINLIWWVKNS